LIHLPTLHGWVFFFVPAHSLLQGKGQFRPTFQGETCMCNSTINYSVKTRSVFETTAKKTELEAIAFANRTFSL